MKEIMFTLHIMVMISLTEIYVVSNMADSYGFGLKLTFSRDKYFQLQVKPLCFTFSS